MRTAIPRATLCLALIALASLASACSEELVVDDPAADPAARAVAAPSSPGVDDGLDDRVFDVAPDDTAALDSTCRLPLVHGPCGAFLPRWGYDPFLGRCRLFVYGGCGGNANNFNTRAACEARCEEPAPACEQSPSYGTCGGFRLRWFFDGRTGACRRFIYSGCGGNDNNFPTLAACEGRCDRDPCATCSPDATCEGTGGAAHCVCDPGFTGDGETCSPIDLCASFNGGCSQFATCTSTGPGTRSCTCALGYAGDGETCSPIDPCTMSNGGCSPFATCTPTGPGTRTCTCAPGTVGDGFTCTLPPPPDPCAMWNGGCSPFATCTPTGDGGRTCTCAAGTVGDGFTCTLPPCECPPAGNEPVCGVDGQTYGSACLAGCAGVAIAAPGECGLTLPDCSLPPAPGTCNEQLDRWYWDAQLQQCRPFVYSGCGGNSNSFADPTSCALVCGAPGPCLPGAPGCPQQ